ncbi:FAD-dependent oxidoreductase [soil metagenome]
MDDNSGWDAEYDLVCAGSGAGGIAAAITAASRGARVLVIEKDGRAGGVTALTGGQIWVAPNPPQTAAGMGDSEADATAYLDFLSAGMGSTDNRRAFVSRGNEALSFLAHAGLGLSIIPGLADYYFPDAPGSKREGRYLEVLPFDASKLGAWADRMVVGEGGMTTPHGGSQLTNADLAEASTDYAELGRRKEARLASNQHCMGSGLMANLLHIALEKGVDVWLGSPAVGLLGTARVEGVVVGGDKPRRVRTRAVVLATGAYDWAPQLVETHEFIKNMYSLTLPTITGDHFALASHFRGATATTLPQGCSRHVGVHIPGETWGGKPLYRMMIMGLPHCVMVNRSGRRFGDESFFHTYSSSAYEFDGHTQSFPNWPAWIVFDQNYRDKYAIGPIAAGAPMPEGMAVMDETLAGLAAKAGIDGAGLETSIARFNEACSKGVDTDFKRGSKPWSNSWGDARLSNPNLGPLVKAPFYAVPLERVGTGLASAGLRTDGDARVIDIGGKPVDGLYAVGNSAARIEMGCGYNSGMAIGRSLVFGYLAGLDATAPRSDSTTSAGAPSSRQADKSVSESAA